ncbi:MarR family transcriptional regulator [Roseomonas sp. OT10]|uniref:MarR family winged helix-turn-helix transcriptional regulator n=1 Tax=Roseomonas cutis TaxID=2897332 RepID=UPI001E5CFD01|nr:MarR family transcriptional regulator [Roseomonas sp. OT10]UFN50842.1 MarR family transcriptional regulator [Roseomonas sp. OT10]
MTDSPTPLEAHLGYWLRYVSNHVSHAFGLKLAAHDVTAAEWVLLRELHERDGAAPSEVAERLGLTRGAISKLAERLIAKALLLRGPGGRDRRTQNLWLTAEGRALVPVLATLADRNDAEFFGHLDPAERQAIEAAMRDIVRRHGLRAAPVG